MIPQFRGHRLRRGLQLLSSKGLKVILSVIVAHSGLTCVYFFMYLLLIVQIGLKIVNFYHLNPPWPACLLYEKVNREEGN